MGFIIKVEVEDTLTDLLEINEEFAIDNIISPEGIREYYKKILNFVKNNPKYRKHIEIHKYGAPRDYIINTLAGVLLNKYKGDLKVAQQSSWSEQIPGLKKGLEEHWKIVVNYSALKRRAS